MEEKSTNQNDQQGATTNSQNKPTLSWSQPTQPSQTNKPNNQSQGNSQNVQQKPTYVAASNTSSTPNQSGWKTGGIVVGILALCVFAVWGMIALRHKSEEMVSITGSSTSMADEGSEKAATTPAPSTSTETAVTQEGGSTTTTPAVSTDVTATLPITVASPQTSGMSVAVSGVSVSVPTWFVVYQDDAGVQGRALGAGLFLPGVKSESIPLLRATEAGKTYFVGESVDDGDRVFTLHGDPETKGADGKVLLITFQTN